MWTEPVQTLGGHFWWRIRRQDSLFVLQEHKVGAPIWWGYPYRILIRANNYVIAGSEVLQEIEDHWEEIQNMKQTFNLDTSGPIANVSAYLLQYFEDRINEI